MAQTPPAEEIARRDRWFAVEFNNLAWTLVEKSGRTAEEEEKLLDAAHGSAAHWRRLGGEIEAARADMLLGEAHALLGHGRLAMRYARRSFEVLLSARDCPDWEVALGHAVLAHAAYAGEELALYEAEYALAKRFGAAIADAGEREMFEKTFRQVPQPRG